MSSKGLRKTRRSHSQTHLAVRASWRDPWLRIAMKDRLRSWKVLMQPCKYSINSRGQIYRGCSNFWSEYAIYFIEWSEKCIFHEWRSHEWNIYFLASRDEINGIFMTNIWIFFSLYTILSRTDFYALYDVIRGRTLGHINYDVWWCEMSAKAETIGAGVEKIKISADCDNLITKVFFAI